MFESRTGLNKQVARLKWWESDHIVRQDAGLESLEWPAQAATHVETLNQSDGRGFARSWC